LKKQSSAPLRLCDEMEFLYLKKDFSVALCLCV